MLLAIDVGNSNTVLGIFRGSELICQWRISTSREKTADEYAVLLRQLFDSARIDSAQIQKVVISSVVPPLNGRLADMCRQYYGCQAIFVEPAQQVLLPLEYQPVSDVGADRVVTAVAALERFSAPLIVVDFGTATTFDAVSREGTYLGGVIAPGLGISAEALFQRASRLPRIEIRKPVRVIGSSTTGSMQSGLFYGYVGLVEGILERMLVELEAVSIIATGGLAQLIASEIPIISHVDENLMLHGLRIYAERI